MARVLGNINEMDINAENMIVVLGFLDGFQRLGIVKIRRRQ